MSHSFQNPKFLRKLYNNENLISSRGKFLKKYSNRRYSMRSFILNVLPEIKNKRILDIGCGDCSFLKNLYKKYPNNEYYGLDIVKNSKCYNLKFINYKIYDGELFPDYNKKFDFIFCMHTLYHINDFKRFFFETKKNLESGGIFTVTTKSKFTLPEIESIFFKIISKLNFKKYLKIKKYRDEEKFCLENGLDILKKYFKHSSFVIDKYVLETQIIVDNKEDLLRYIFSTQRYNLTKEILNKKIANQYIGFWRKEFDKFKIFIDKYIEVIYVIKKL